MKKIKLKLSSEKIFFVVGSQQKNRKISINDYNKFRQWIDSYNKALTQEDTTNALLKIGKDIYNWLNGDEHWLETLLDTVEPPLIIEFTIPRNADENQLAFIEVPWELIANEEGHLALNRPIKLCPVRRIGERTDVKKPSDYRLNTLFMAAAPRNSCEPLSYENEESAILNLYSNHSRNMELFVEESGNIDLLADLNNKIKPVDIVHISCHGNNVPKPFILLETETGDEERITPNKFADNFTATRPSLVFLSACKTSEPDREGNTFSLSLIVQGFQAVLGWSSSVSDFEATYFASEFYRNLSLRTTLESAVANARFALFDPRKDDFLKEYKSKDWHLARLYLGPCGGGKFSNGTKKRFIRNIDAGVEKFLDKDEKIPVANRAEFVGRRRQIQDILSEFRKTANNHAGVLIHGMGRQGKSSLAARIANRLHNYNTVVIFEDYSTYNILKKFESIINRNDANNFKKQLAEIKNDGNNLYFALKELLEKSFSGANDQQPVLLVIDDLERILENPADKTKLHRIKTDYRTAIISVIKAFNDANTDSKLIITSRFKYNLCEDNINYSEKLLNIPLASMNETERKKQLDAKVKSEESSCIIPDDFKKQITKFSMGNSGLQNFLFKCYVDTPEKYEKTIKNLEKYIENGNLPTEQKLKNFLQNINFDDIIKLLSDDELIMLRASTLFEIPLPEEVFDTIMDNLKIQKNQNYKKRLIGFGLWEISEDILQPQIKALVLNNIIRPKIEEFKKEEMKVFKNPEVLDCARIRIMLYADLKKQQNGYNFSLKLYKNVYKIFKKTNNINGEAVVLNCIARIEEKKGNFDVALQLHKKRKNIYEKTKDEFNKLMCLADIAILNAQIGKIFITYKIYKEELYPYSDELIYLCNVYQNSLSTRMNLRDFENRMRIISDLLRSSPLSPLIMLAFN